MDTITAMIVIKTIPAMVNTNIHVIGAMKLKIILVYLAKKLNILKLLMGIITVLTVSKTIFVMAINS